MLYSNIKRLFEIRGIKNPKRFLTDNGFSQHSAYNIVNMRFTSLRLNVVEKLCILLSCTPNDLLEWTKPKNSNIPDSHPLHSLAPKNQININDIFKDVEVSKIPELINNIESLKSNLK